MTAACAAVLEELRALGRPETIEGRERFAIKSTCPAFGVTVTRLRVIARPLRRNQPLAEELWEAAFHETRVLATLVADPKLIASHTIDRWAAEADSWDICDACAFNLFDRTPFAWHKVAQFAADEREFVRRAGFATLAGLAVHDKKAPNEPFIDALALIERYACDDRNFVRKAVNWALRGIGKRNEALLFAAIACAERIRGQGTRSARWIAADALRELRPRIAR